MAHLEPGTGRRLLAPVDHDLARRAARLHALGLGSGEPLPYLDKFARDLAYAAADLAGIPEAPYAMVNLITAHHQYFAGLHEPGQDGSGLGGSSVGRIMSRDHGYCPEVLDRRRPLVLADVCAYPRFDANPVVDQLGIRTYLGAPLIDEASGTVLGTVCVVDTQPRQWGRPGLELIKDFRDQVMARITETDNRPHH
nr:GAF domain-containing protein [Kitasatospora purpeofusca]